MAKKPVHIEIIEEDDVRYLLKVFDDGSEVRHPIVKETRRKKLRRIDWSRKLGAGSKRGF